MKQKARQVNKDCKNIKTRDETTARSYISTGKLLCCLQSIQKMLLDKKNGKEEMEYTEPAKWDLHKIDDGRWQFVWENGHGHGECSGDFDHCLRCMDAFKDMLIGKPRITIEGAVQELLSKKSMALAWASFHHNAKAFDKEQKACKKAAINGYEASQLMRIQKSIDYVHELAADGVCSIHAGSVHVVDMILKELESSTVEGGASLAKQLKKIIPRQMKKGIARQRDAAGMHHHPVHVLAKQEETTIVEQAT